MPYSVLIDQYLDFTGQVNLPSVVGSIWVPAPSDGTHPGTPTFTGTVTAAPGTPPVLTFPALGGPPTTDSAMLISQPSSGDLYRLAGAAPPANPAHLNGDCMAGSALSRSDLDSLTANFGSQTSPVPWYVQAAYGALTLGAYFPTSITVSAVSLTLPTAPATGFLTMTLTGTVAIQHWLWTSNNSFTFTEMVALAPSGDPVDTSRIVAAAGSSATMTITGGAIVAPVLVGSIAAQATQDLERRFNQAIGSAVAQVLAGLTPPQQLSPQAVISAFKVVITASGLVLTLSVADIFGSAIVPVPGNLAASISPAVVYNEKVDYVVTVTDFASKQPVAGAVVKLFNPGPSGDAESTTDANGRAQLSNVTLDTKEITDTHVHPPITITEYPYLNITAAGFSFLRMVLYSMAN
jgi:hypothetical protein